MNRLTPATIIAAAAMSACSMQQPDPTGEWTRNVADETMGIRGIEHLNLAHDSTLRVVNELCLTHDDTIFHCSIRFTTTVTGRWQIADGNIALTYDATTFSLDTVAGGVNLSAVDTSAFNDSLRSQMLGDLTDALTDYYKSVYEALGSNSPLQLNGISITADTLSAWNSSTHITWIR